MSNNSFKRKISDNVFKALKSSMPPISQTEREAIEGGDTWVEANLFQGNFNREVYENIQNSSLRDDEKSFIENEVEGLLALLNDYEINEKKDLPKEVWDYLKANKFFAMIIPKKFGGLEFSALGNSTVVSKIASVSVNAAVSVMVPNSLGPGELLMHYGTEEQQNHWLPRLADGTDIPCFGLTSPVAGSDAGAIPDNGIVVKKKIDGKEVIGLEINFEKRYITLAPVASLLGLAFKMYDPDKILSDRVDYGITCALIPMNHEGIDNSNRHLPMNLAFMNGPIFGKNVFIPLDWIIGGVKNAGKGWQMLISCLSAGRGISLPAMSAATTHSLYRSTSAYSYVRKQFGLSIGKFEGIEEGLAKIAGYNYINEAVRRFTTTSLDLGHSPSVITAITKYHTTELAREATNLSMDIHAGKGIIQGKTNYLNNAYLGMPVAITVEGANILTRNLMIFGQGSLRCHPYLFDEMEILNAEDIEQAKIDFENILQKHIKFTLKNGFSSFFNGLTFGHFNTPFTGSKLKSESKIITRFSKALSVVSDLSLLVLGGKLKQSEYLSARLGDVLSYLYMSAAVIKYAEENNTEEDYIHARWALKYMFYKMGQAFDEVFYNFPNKLVGLKMRAITFPFGICFKMPKHKDSRKLIKIMHDYNSDFRDRMSELSTLNGKNNPVFIVEDAFKQTFNTVDLEKIVVKARRDGVIDSKLSLNEQIKAALQAGLLNQEQYELLISAENRRMDAIHVDHIKK